jgi:hypothetical protein
VEYRERLFFVFFRAVSEAALEKAAFFCYIDRTSSNALGLSFAKTETGRDKVPDRKTKTTGRYTCVPAVFFVGLTQCDIRIDARDEQDQ